MALLIPENLKTRADVSPGTKVLARVLQEALEDAATVWFEPLFDPSGHRPDLAVLAPEAGVLLLEVLEAKAGAIREVKDGHLLVEGSDGIVRNVVDPLARALRLGAALTAALAAEPRLADDERLPVVAGGVFAYLSRDEAVGKGLGAAIDLERCLFRDDLAAGHDDPASLRPILARLLKTPLRDPLSEEAERVHRAVIHPDTVIGTDPLPFPSVTPETDLKVLDRAQESLAKALGEGHRVIRGVAGSGKTLVLTYRVRLLARSFPQHRILITCFNRSLSGMLRRQLPFENVSVRTIDALINDIHRAAKQPLPPFDRTELGARASTALALMEQALGTLTRYDHVLVDEAQDFPTSALQVVVSMLRDGSDSLLVVADAAQNIYQNKFTWKAAGINATGRTRVLDMSYRNTVEILTYAHGFLKKGTTDTEGDGDELILVEPRSNPRHGPPPAFLHFLAPQEEVVAIAERCRGLIDEGVSPGSIAVLYGSSNAGSFGWPHALQRRLRECGVPFLWITDPAHKENRTQLGADPDKVVLSTIHSAKGFEFVHVFLCGYLDEKPEETPWLNRRLIYVGMTRATEGLVLTASGHHPFIADLDTEHGDRVRQLNGPG